MFSEYLYVSFYKTLDLLKQYTNIMLQPLVTPALLLSKPFLQFYTQLLTFKGRQQTRLSQSVWLYIIIALFSSAAMALQQT